MNKFFEEKLVVIKDDAGTTLEFFMRPIKVGEFKLINRIDKLTEDGDSSEFVDPILLELLSNSVSIDTSKIPVTVVSKLVDEYIEYNFPAPKEKDEKRKLKKVKTKAKKNTKRLAVYIDFLVHQGHSIPDIMDLTIVQFNELIEAAADRINPPKKVMDAADVFSKLNIPIKPRKSSGR